MSFGQPIARLQQVVDGLRDREGAVFQSARPGPLLATAPSRCTGSPSRDAPRRARVRHGCSASARIARASNSTRSTMSALPANSFAHDLDRDRRIQLQVRGAQNDAHAALAQAAIDAILVTDDAAGKKSRAVGHCHLRAHGLLCVNVARGGVREPTLGLLVAREVPRSACNYAARRPNPSTCTHIGTLGSPVHSRPRRWTEPRAAYD